MPLKRLQGTHIRTGNGSVSSIRVVNGHNIPGWSGAVPLQGFLAVQGSGFRVGGVGARARPKFMYAQVDRLAHRSRVDRLCRIDTLWCGANT